MEEPAQYFHGVEEYRNGVWVDPYGPEASPMNAKIIRGNGPNPEYIQTGTGFEVTWWTPINSNYD